MKKLLSSSQLKHKCARAWSSSVAVTIIAERFGFFHLFSFYSIQSQRYPKMCFHVLNIYEETDKEPQIRSVVAKAMFVGDKTPTQLSLDKLINQNFEVQLIFFSPISKMYIPKMWFLPNGRLLVTETETSVLVLAFCSLPLPHHWAVCVALIQIIFKVGEITRLQVAALLHLGLKHLRSGSLGQKLCSSLRTDIFLLQMKSFSRRMSGMTVSAPYAMSLRTAFPIKGYPLLHVSFFSIWTALPSLGEARLCLTS